MVLTTSGMAQQRGGSAAHAQQGNLPKPVQIALVILIKSGAVVRDLFAGFTVKIDPMWFPVKLYVVPSIKTKFPSKGNFIAFGCVFVY